MTRTYRAIVAEDEPVIREGLVAAIRAHLDFVVVAESRDGREALEAIRTHRPDVVFLDVQMPFLSGLDVAGALDDVWAPVIVFVTAHESYAVPAFEIDAVDYLVKPFTARRLAETLERIRKRIGATEERSEDGGIRRLVAVERGRKIVIDVRAVRWFEAAGNYARLFGEPFGTALVRVSFRELATALPDSRFTRVHRSRIVNNDAVREIRPTGSGDAVVVLDDGTEVASSRTYRRARERILSRTRG